ncbi:MAG: hypothetical protein J5646_08075 [Bacteroidales bacterium]|nr:hypothetical protein [Bacteroidales bacterium]
MAKRSTIAAVVLVAVLLAGIAIAVTKLYTQVPGEETVTPAPTGWNVLRAVPSDAAAVLVFDGSAKAARILADSTGLLQGFVAPGDAAFMAFIQSLSRRKMAVSLHNSGTLVPLVAAQIQPTDTVARKLAAQAGLKTLEKEGYLLACRSETFVNASARHLVEGLSILGTRRLQDLVSHVSGQAVLLVSHAHASKLLQTYAGTEYRKESFVKDLTAWSAWTIQDAGKDQILFKGLALPGEASASFFGAFAGTSAQVAEFPEAVPYYTATAVAVPIPDVDAYLASRRKLEDGEGRLAQYNKALKAKAGRPLSPEEWFRNLQPRELVRISFYVKGDLQEAVLVKSARDLKLGTGASNEYRGVLAQVAGEGFAVTDTLCASLGGKWRVFGSAPAVQALQDASIKEYSLKNRLADASVSLPAGFVAYSSLTDAPDVPDRLLVKDLAQPLKDFALGAGFAPATVALDLSGELPALRVQVSTHTLKGNKVQVMERDTTVTVPAGPFPVNNYFTGKTNSLYQNSSLSICLNDENGKGVWGIPFKETICGRVQNVDFYKNGKIQFLFAAGDKLYMLDRLGHWVNGFPVKLPKAVLLGPDVYDFTGIGGYSVMVLHKDNSLERYNLHGQKPDGWKGIKAPETVKNLPELLEVNGKHYWVVRTSVRTLVYPFGGGEPLVKEEGNKMLRPDAQLKITSKGISGECYDGRTRDYKLN